MKTNVIRVIFAAFAAFAALCVSACGHCEVGGQQQQTGGGHPQPRQHNGPQGPRQFVGGPNNGTQPPVHMQSPREREIGPQTDQLENDDLVDNGTEFHRPKWQNGVTHHEYSVKISVSSFNQVLTESEKVALANRLEEWAVAKVKAGGQPPTDADITAEAQRMVGHKRVRAKVENNFSENFIAQERTLVSREKIAAEDVPEDARVRLEQRAKENFYRNRTNETVEDGRFYPN